MKKIITIVGTSFIENYEKENGLLCSISHLDSPSKLYHDPSDSQYVSNLTSWANNKSTELISAEVSSLYRIQQEFNEDLEVYLIATDTISAKICSEAIRIIFFSLDKINIRQVKIIQDLRIFKLENFNRGKDNLIKHIVKLMNEFVNGISPDKRDKFISKNVKINITGGYKGLIPLMTILSQLYECEVVYKFEKSDDLIRIPRIPINFDPVLTESLYFDIWYKLETHDHSFKHFEKLKEYGFIDNKDKITALGDLFYEMVQKKQAIGKNVFGYFVEYKVLEYLYTNGCDGFEHSYKEFNCELDFVNRLTNDKLEVWEIKSAIDFLIASNVQEKKAQIEKQIMCFPSIIKHKLVVYSIEPELLLFIRDSVKNVMNELKSKYSTIEFSADFLELTGMSIGKQTKNSNPYQALFKSSLKEENFIKIH